MRRIGSVLCVGVIAAVVVAAVAVRRSTGNDAPAGGGPGGVVDRAMGLIGGGQIDDAVAQMDFAKDDTTNLKNNVRDALITVRNAPLGTYRGYDVSAVVRFSPRLQTLDVLAYYDAQPVLYRFQYYQPSDNAAWLVLGLAVDRDLASEMTTLRDDAAGAALGRGGRAAR